MTPPAEFVPIDNATWIDLVMESDADFYHFPAYASLAAEREGGRPIAFVTRTGGDSLVVPLIERTIPGTSRCDIVSPYGYPGPLVARPTNPEFWHAGWAAFSTTAREHGYVSAFVRTHPILNANDTLPEGAVEVLHGPTLSMDLRGSEAEIEANMRGQTRKDVRRLRRDGFTTQPNGLAAWRAFERMYADSMDRMGVSEYYRFPPSYFEGLRALGDHVHLITASAPNGTTVSGAIGLVSGRFAQYHLAAASGEAPATAKLCVDELWRWARKRGATTFHLGGGVGSQRDSLFQFKAGFGRTEWQFRTWRFIIDAPAYHALSAKARIGDPRGFFPAYRRPLPPDSIGGPS